ncbi:uncharacterized protein [Zea mays]|nr:uncharacterized protein LOC100274924 isoform X1 [Zea mays]
MGLTFPYFLSLLGSRLPRVVVLSGLQATPNHTATHSRRGEGEARRRGGQGTPLSSPRSHKSDGRSVLVGIPCHFVDRPRMMFDDQDLGFFANFLGIFIFVLVIAYHFVMADPKYEGN